MTVTAATITLPKADIRFVETSGKGMPIILLHGSSASKAAFGHQLESPLADAHRMIAIDLPGHGGSSDARSPADTYTVKGYATVIGEVLDRLRIERAVFFGWSLGGHIAVDMMGWHPAVAGVMLSGAPPIQRGPLGLLRGFLLSRDIFLTSKPAFTADDAQRFFVACYGDTGTPELLEAIKRADGRARKIMFNGLMRGDGIDQRRMIEMTTIPTAMVNGARDPFVRLSYIAGAAYGSLWDGICHVIEDAGHAPFWEKPEPFNALLTRFAGDIAARDTLRNIGAEPRIARAG